MKIHFSRYSPLRVQWLGSVTRQFITKISYLICVRHVLWKIKAENSVRDKISALHVQSIEQLFPSFFSYQFLYHLHLHLFFSFLKKTQHARFSDDSSASHKCAYLCTQRQEWFICSDIVIIWREWQQRVSPFVSLLYLPVEELRGSTSVGFLSIGRLE